MGLITYFVGDSTLYVLTITPSGITLRNQPTGIYTSLASQYMSLLSKSEAINAHFSQFLTVSNALYQQVWLL